MSKGGECQAAEIEPGLLIVTGRNDDAGFTEIAYSLDDGMSWNAVRAPARTQPPVCAAARNPPVSQKKPPDQARCAQSVANPDLPSPIDGVEASLVAHPNGQLYHSSPASHVLRTNMVVKVSSDRGHSWALHKQVWPAAAGYSALAVLGHDADAPLGLLYDRNNRSMLVFEAQGVSFTTMPP